MITSGIGPGPLARRGVKVVSHNFPREPEQVLDQGSGFGMFYVMPESREVLERYHRVSRTVILCEFAVVLHECVQIAQLGHARIDEGAVSQRFTCDQSIVRAHNRNVRVSRSDVANMDCLTRSSDRDLDFFDQSRFKPILVVDPGVQQILAQEIGPVAIDVWSLAKRFLHEMRPDAKVFVFRIGFLDFYDACDDAAYLNHA